MIRNTVTGLFCTILLLLHSCAEDDVSKIPDYLVFGHFYGFCIGESCIQIYKLENDKLYMDTSHQYPRYDEFYLGAYVEMEDSLFGLVNDLRDHFPEQLLYEQDTVFGCPDCADQGGLYIEYKSDNIHKYWIIDQFAGNVPVYLHQYMDKVNEKIDLLNN